MCPVHAVRELLRVQRRQRKGQMFFVTPAAFTKGLRRHAEAAGLVRAQQRCSHEFRRGTARELVKQGGTLGHIMKAGDWSSAAFTASDATSSGPSSRLAAFTTARSLARRSAMP